MQHLMDDDHIVAIPLHRQGIDIAMAHLRIAQTSLFEIGARHRQHGRAGINADDALGARRQ